MEPMFFLISSLLSGIPSVMFSIAGYVLTSLAIYTMSRRRGLSKPWLAWIPVLNVWLLGSLSDQYQYVVNGQNRSRRKILLILSILRMALVVVIAVLAGVAVATATYGGYRYHSGFHSGIWGSMAGILGLGLPLAGTVIAYAVIRYMALYDVYKSMDPVNCVLYLVLSVLFGITEPFFLFFNRNKEGGMPPRKQRPAEPWERETVENL